MAPGTHKPNRGELYIPASESATGPGHPLYTKLNNVLNQTGFDRFVEKCGAPASAIDPEKHLILQGS
jgi:hypothetical protein